MVWSWILIDHNGEEKWCSDVVPPATRNTNNIAEWYALGYGLQSILELGITPDVLRIEGDSQLVINQLTGEWQCRKPYLRVLMNRCHELLHGWKWSAHWIGRELNTRADQHGRDIYLQKVGSPMPDRRKSA